MIKVGILGATGYAGIEVVRLLTAHLEAEIVRVVSQSFVGQKISDVYQNLKGICDLCCTALDVNDIAGSCDLCSQLCLTALLRPLFRHCMKRV